ncbi:MAG: CGLD27 family protein [Cyanobium sp.]
MNAPGPAGDTVLCPVPPEQRPLSEYEQLLASWFFVWPAGAASVLPRALALSWLALLPPALLVASGSYLLQRHPLLLVFSAMIAALLLPLLLLVRQWLGWSYVQRRLISERVDYEESGWYDGQSWEKPLAWRQRDLLVSQHEVAPVLQRLRRSIGWIVALMVAGGVLFGGGLCQAL